jgi:hypothetical protein
MPEEEQSAWERLVDLPEHLVGEILDGVLRVSRVPRARMRWRARAC